MNNLAMEIRSVDAPERVLVGVVAPYDEISYLTPDPAGERIMRGAFKKSIAQRADKVALMDNHAATRRMGISRSFEDGPEGLVGTFAIYEGSRGDALLEDLRHGYLGGMSVGLQPLQVTRGSDGVREVREAKLIEVSVVGHPAYEGAGLLAVRAAVPAAELFPPRPEVNLEPIVWRW